MAIDFRKIREDLSKNQQIAKLISNVMYKDVSDEEWIQLLETKNSPIYYLIEKIQDGIYNYYLSKLAAELQLAANGNKRVEADIYGGLLKGLYESNIRTICEEGKRRQENRKKQDLRDTA